MRMMVFTMCTASDLQIGSQRAGGAHGSGCFHCGKTGRVPNSVCKRSAALTGKQGIASVGEVGGRLGSRRAKEVLKPCAQEHHRLEPEDL